MAKRRFTWAEFIMVTVGEALLTWPKDLPLAPSLKKIKELTEQEATSTEIASELVRLAKKWKGYLCKIHQLTEEELEEQLRKGKYRRELTRYFWIDSFRGKLESGEMSIAELHRLYRSHAPKDKVSFEAFQQHVKRMEIKSRGKPGRPKKPKE